MEEKTEKKLSRESAEKQVEIFFDHYEIEPDDKMEGQVKVIESAKKEMTRAVMRGRLEFVEKDKKLTVIQHLRNGETTIEYKELNGAAKLAMDKKDDGNYKRIFALLGYLSGLGENVFKELSGADLSLAETIGTIFLMV